MMTPSHLRLCLVSTVLASAGCIGLFYYHAQQYGLEVNWRLAILTTLAILVMGIGCSVILYLQSKLTAQHLLNQFLINRADKATVKLLNLQNDFRFPSDEQLITHQAPLEPNMFTKMHAASSQDAHQTVKSNKSIKPLEATVLPRPQSTPPKITSKQNLATKTQAEAKQKALVPIQEKKPSTKTEDAKTLQIYVDHRKEANAIYLGYHSVFDVKQKKIAFAELRFRSIIPNKNGTIHKLLMAAQYSEVDRVAMVVASSLFLLNKKPPTQSVILPMPPALLESTQWDTLWSKLSPLWNNLKTPCYLLISTKSYLTQQAGFHHAIDSLRNAGANFCLQWHAMLNLAHLPIKDPAMIVISSAQISEILHDEQSTIKLGEQIKQSAKQGIYWIVNETNSKTPLDELLRLGIRYVSVSKLS